MPNRLTILLKQRLRAPGLIRFLRARLNPASYLGLELTLGALALIAASWAFGSIADEVLENEELVALDTQLSQWLHAMATPVMTTFMHLVSDVHDVMGMTILVAIVALVFAWKKHWTWLLVLMLAVPGGATLNVTMKSVFQRARPQFESPLVMLSDYSFPSGHTCASTLFYGVLAAYLVRRIRSSPGRAVVCVAALTMVTLVAFSRLYLGAHFLSDVLAGFAEGVAWLALCLTATHTFARHRDWKRTVSTSTAVPIRKDPA